MISTPDSFTVPAVHPATYFSAVDWKSKLQVFLVEDSPVICLRLKRMLADVQVDVIGEAQDAQEAIEGILKEKPDVVILDIHLRTGNGIDVLQNLKKNMPASKVIVLTNYPYPQYRQKCLEAGADFFFVKSTQFDQIVPVLTQLMQPDHSMALSLVE